MGPAAKILASSLAAAAGWVLAARPADAPAPLPPLETKHATATSVEAVVAVIGPLSGRAAAYGTSQREGAVLAAEEVAAAGGRGGASIRLVFADDQADQTKAGALARDLAAKDGVAALIGAINSDCTHQIEMVAVKLHVPQLTTASTDPSVTDTGSPWIFRCLADDVLQSRAIASRLFGNGGGERATRPKRVALLSQNNRYGRMGIAEVAKAAAAARAEVVVREGFESGTEDFGPLASRVAASAPDGIVVWSLYREGAALVRALRSAGVRAEILAGDGLASPEFARLAGEAAEGTVVTYPFDPDASERSRGFVQRFASRFGHPPDSFAAHAYDAVLCLAAAAARAGSWDRAALKDALAQTRAFAGATGDLTFDATGNDARPVKLAKIEGGRFVPMGEGP